MGLRSISTQTQCIFTHCMLFTAIPRCQQPVDQNHLLKLTLVQLLTNWLPEENWGKLMKRLLNGNKFRRCNFLLLFGKSLCRRASLNGEMPARMTWLTFADELPIGGRVLSNQSEHAQFQLLILFFDSSFLLQCNTLQDDQQSR